MGINVKSIVGQLEMSDKIEENLMGIDKMQWSVMNYKENTDEVKHKLAMMRVTIDSYIAQYKERREKKAKMIELVKAQLGANVKNIWTELFDVTDQSDFLLAEVINQTALMLDAQQIAIDNQTTLLSNAVDAGFMHKELEIKLKEVQSLISLVNTGMDNQQKQFMEMMKQTSERFAKLIELANKPEIDFSPVEGKISENKMEVSYLRDRVSQLESQLRDLTMKVAESPASKSESTPAEDKKAENAKFMNELEKAVRDEGITDLMTMQKHMSRVMSEPISLQKIRTNGFSELVKQYSKKKIKKQEPPDDPEDEEGEDDDAEV